MFSVESDCKFAHDSYLLKNGTCDSASLPSSARFCGVSANPFEAPSKSCIEGLRKVCLCGAGHGGHVFAAVLASKGIQIRILATRPEQVERFIQGGMSVAASFASTGKTITGKVDLVTVDPELAAQDADLVLVCVPTFLHEGLLRAVAPFLRPGTPVGTVEGGWWGKPCFPGMEALSFFVMETLPWACRVSSFGTAASVLGTKATLGIASSPATLAPTLCAVLGEALEFSFYPVSNLLGMCALDASNVLHPGIMFGRLSNWKEGQSFETSPLFYQGVDEFTEGVLLEMEADFFAVRDKILELYPELDLTMVCSVQGWLCKAYEGQIPDCSTLGSCLRTNPAYRGLVFPTQPNSSSGQPGLVPLFNYRYLTSDAAVHLMVLRGIAELLGVPTPGVDKVLLWAQSRLGQEWLRDGKVQGKDLDKTRAPQACGVTTLEALLRSAR